MSPTIAETIEAASPAECACRQTGDQQSVVGRGQTTGQRGQAESRVEDHQRAFAIKAVEDEPAGKTADRRRQAIRGHEMGELGGRNVETAHELRAQRHHDHEIEDVRELHGAERQKRGAFAVPVREHGAGRNQT